MFLLRRRASALWALCAQRQKGSIFDGRPSTVFDDADTFDRSRQKLEDKRRKFDAEKERKAKMEEPSSSSSDSASSTAASAREAETIPVSSTTLAAQLRTNLSERHRAMAEGVVPPAIYEDEKEKWELGERFGRYGLGSGVDIRKLWPTLEEIKEIEDLRMYRDAKDAMRIASASKAAEKRKVAKRVAEIRNNWANYDKELEEFERSRRKIIADKTEKEELLDARIREIQEYFGYWIDPQDPRFTVMLQQKELEEKKAAKKAKNASKKSKNIGQIIGN